VKKPPKRHRAIRIALYNNKGGVGKTTLTANIAAALRKKKKNVLLIDSDPQCNLTSYLVEEGVVDNLLDESDTDKGQTIWSALKPIVALEGSFKQIEIIETSTGLRLIPGDIRLAEWEEYLNNFWTDCLGRKIGGFKGTNSLSEIINYYSNELNIDYVFYDTGPNIGPLNRIILLDCDYFIVPAACDLFSLRALKTLGHTLGRWIFDWNTILSLAPTDTYIMPGKPKFLGYIPQRFKTYGGVIASASSEYVAKIEKAISSDVLNVLKKIDESLISKNFKRNRLGEIKDLTALVQLAQKEGVPIFAVSAGVNYQKQEALEAFEKIANNIIERVEG